MRTMRKERNMGSVRIVLFCLFIRFYFFLFYEFYLSPFGWLDLVWVCACAFVGLVCFCKRKR